MNSLISFWAPYFATLPLARKFPGKRKFWALAGKMTGNPFWKEIDRKYNELPG
jgi:hypothetical protein